MDFTVLPIECALCIPSPHLRPRPSLDTLAPPAHELAVEDGQPILTPTLQHKRTASTINTLPTGFSGASTAVESEPEPSSPVIEQLHLHKTEDTSKGIDPQFKYGRAQGDTCASCAFTVPHDVASKIPKGAPGSLKADDKAKNTAPVLRSREFVCLGPAERSRRSKVQAGQSSSHGSACSSFQSYGSQDSHRDCHDHTLTYLTTKSPDNPETYAQLRASVIRTLSCEQLPKGMSDGPLCFGDDNTGYTIAYVFRLTDPKARGRRRAYAFVALAGHNTGRAFKACPLLWEAFATMASRIEEAAQRYQDEQQKMEEEEDKRRNYVSVSAFLTQRANDPDGHLRRAGQTTPRSLADIVGDENIFAILHQYFVAVLRCLGDQFGGLPMVPESSMYRSPGSDAEHDQVQTSDKLHDDTVLADESLVSARTPSKNELEQAKHRVNKKLRSSSQCGPLLIGTTAQGQVVV